MLVTRHGSYPRLKLAWLDPVEVLVGHQQRVLREILSVDVRQSASAQVPVGQHEKLLPRRPLHRIDTMSLSHAAAPSPHKTYRRRLRGTGVRRITRTERHTNHAGTSRILPARSFRLGRGERSSLPSKVPRLRRLAKKKDPANAPRVTCEGRGRRIQPQRLDASGDALVGRPCHLQKPFHDDLVDVPVSHLEVTFGSTDRAEALSLIGSEGSRVVGADVGEQLLVALGPGGGKGGCEETSRHALAAAGSGHVRAEYADVVEEAGVGRERLEAL